MSLYHEIPKDKYYDFSNSVYHLYTHEGIYLFLIRERKRRLNKRLSPIFTLLGSDQHPGLTLLTLTLTFSP